MRTVAFIPSRLNSQRVPGKNIKMLGGKPLVNYVLEAANEVEELDEIIIFSSDEDIAKHIRPGLRYKLIKRPTDLDTQTAGVQDLIREFLKVDRADVIAMLHITSPFLRPETIAECVRQVVSGGYESAFTAGAMRRNCWFKGKLINGNSSDGYHSNVSGGANVSGTTEILPDAVLVEQSFYVFRRSVFESYNRRISEDPYIKIIDDLEGMDIDTTQDLQIAELIMSSRDGASYGK